MFGTELPPNEVMVSFSRESLGHTVLGRPTHEVLLQPLENGAARRASN
jgi:hypothetical protein